MPINLNEPVNEPVVEEVIDDKDKILDLLNADDDEPVVEEPVKEDEPVVEDEDEEIKLETGEEKIDEDEVLIPVARKEILKKYPNLFKEFPQLDKSYYKAKEYDNLVGTVADARELVERNNEYKKVETAVNDGNIAPVLKNLAEGNGAAFNKLVDDYLPQLHAVNPSAYYHVVGGIIKKTIVNMVNSAKTDGNDDLREAAVILNKFIFRNNEFVPETPFGPGRSNENNPEVDKLRREKLEGLKEKFENASENLSKSTGTVIRNTITAHIDPRNVMTDYVKRTAIRDTLENVEKTLNADTSFVRTMRRLWEKAEQEQFSKSSIDKIHQTYIAKAKTVLPDSIKKSRNEALKGLGKRVVNNDTNQRRMPVGGGNTSRETKEEKTPTKGMKTVDFFMQD